MRGFRGWLLRTKACRLGVGFMGTMTVKKRLLMAAIGRLTLARLGVAGNWCLFKDISPDAKTARPVTNIPPVFMRALCLARQFSRHCFTGVMHDFKGRGSAGAHWPPRPNPAGAPGGESRSTPRPPRGRAFVDG